MPLNDIFLLSIVGVGAIILADHIKTEIEWYRWHRRRNRK